MARTEEKLVPALQITDPRPLVAIGAFERALAEIENVDELKRLHDDLGALHHLAKRMHLCLEDQNRISTLRIRAARKAGRILHESVRQGGNSCGGSSAPLPAGISWNQSSRWQKLAKLDEELVERYVAEANQREEEVTVAGLARASSNLDVHFSSETGEWLTPPEIVAAVIEVLGKIDLDPALDEGGRAPLLDLLPHVPSHEHHRLLGERPND